MTPFPWRTAMEVGFGAMRLSSREFWALTPRELAAAFRALRGAGGVPPERGALEAMMTAFPDEETRHG